MEQIVDHQLGGSLTPALLLLARINIMVVKMSPAGYYYRLNRLDCWVMALIWFRIKAEKGVDQLFEQMSEWAVCYSSYLRARTKGWAGLAYIVEPKGQKQVNPSFQYRIILQFYFRNECSCMLFLSSSWLIN